MALVSSILTPDYTWDDSLGIYRDAAGKFVSAADVRTAIDAVIDSSAAYMKGLASQLQSGAIDLAAFQLAGEEEIRMVALANAAAARGGWAQLTGGDYLKINDIAAEQLQFWSDLCDGIADGNVPLDGRFVLRAASYANGGRGTFENFHRDEMTSHGADEERSVRSASDSCPGCLDAAAQGWQPVGSLSLPGDRECMNNCRCSMEFRNSVTGQIFA